MIGDPRPDFDGNSREWTCEFEADEGLQAVLKKQKLTDRLKEPKPDKNGNLLPGREGTKYLRLKQKEINSRGEANDPVPIVDRDGKTPWDGRLLGNGTVVDVKISIGDFGPGKKKAIYPQKFRVVELVEFAKNDFDALDAGENEPPFKRDDFNKDFGLDDEVNDIL